MAEIVNFRRLLVLPEVLMGKEAILKTKLNFKTKQMQRCKLILSS